MGFDSGTVSFRRFAVVGKGPKSADEELLEKLDGYALRPDESVTVEEEEYGWCGGRHVLDGKFAFEHNIFNDAVHFALRIDTNKMPSELKRAYAALEEESVAATNPSGFISKKQKKDVKDLVRLRIEEETKSGRFRRSKLLPILWDLPTATLCTSASGKSAEKLIELFDRTFRLELEPVTAGTLGQRMMQEAGKRRDYEDLRPTRFAPGPDGEGQFPEYPWAAKGDAPKDFLGNEFLLWLWHEAETQDGDIKVEGGDVTVMIDHLLELDCAYGATGKDALRATGPTHMPEARDGLKSGKVPRKAGLVLVAGGQQYDLTLSAEALAVGGCKLPPVEEAESARVLFEERVILLRDLCKALDGMYGAFLKARVGSGWESRADTIRKWIAGGKVSRARAVVA